MKKGVVIVLGLILASTLLFSIASSALVSANWFSDFFGKVTGQVTASAPSWSGSYCICNQGSPLYGCDDAGGAINCNQAKVFTCPLNYQNCDGVNGCDPVMGVTCPASGDFGFRGVSQSCGNSRCDTKYETTANCPSDCVASSTSSGSSSSSSSSTGSYEVLSTVDLAKKIPMRSTGICPANVTLGSFEVGPFNSAVTVVTTTPICVDDYLEINGQIVTDTSQNSYCGPAKTSWSGTCIASGKTLLAIPANTKITLVIYDTIGVSGGANGTIEFRADSSTSDLNAPVISNVLPTGTVNSNAAYINLTTDENATCKYSSDQSNWISLSTTGGKVHSQYLTSLSNGQNTFYLKCKDSSGNENKVSSIVSFTVASSTPTCSDSDGGLNYYAFGNITSGNLASSVGIREDTCVGDSLREMFCLDNIGTPQLYACPNGCLNGVCRNATSVVYPLEHDIGNFHYEKKAIPESFGEGWKIDAFYYSTNNGKIWYAVYFKYNQSSYVDEYASAYPNRKSYFDNSPIFRNYPSDALWKLVNNSMIEIQVISYADGFDESDQSSLDPLISTYLQYYPAIEPTIQASQPCLDLLVQ